jgi:predicted ATPase
MIERAVFQNFKSIAHCDVSLGQLTFLVGPNGSGKSNFLEALRFLSYSLTTSLAHAVETRFGFKTILRNRESPEGRIRMQLYLRLGEQRNGIYTLEFSGDDDKGLQVHFEACHVQSPEAHEWFTVADGALATPSESKALTGIDRQYLPAAASKPPFQEVYRVLTGIRAYNPAPDEMRTLQPSKPYKSLDRTASNLGEMIRRIGTASPERLERIIEYLTRISPGITAVEAVEVESHFAIHFRRELDTPPAGFRARNMSDGTLRALALLVAVFQPGIGSDTSLVCLEEPEAGLHPAAAGVLYDSLVEASWHVQIIATSHSPDLLDRPDVPIASLFAVTMEQGDTVIGDLDDQGKAALQKQLFTAGELPRMGQLRPGPRP